MSTIAITELRVRPRPDGLVVAVAALLGAGFGVLLARSRGSGPGVPSLLPETAGALILSFLISLFLARFPGKKVVAGNTDGDTDGGVRPEEPAIDTTASSTTNSASDPQPDWSWVTWVSGLQRGELNAILLEIFPSRSAFSRFLLHKLGKSLKIYADSTLGMEDAIHQVVEGALDENWLVALVTEIDADPEKNIQLRAWASRTQQELPAEGMEFQHVERSVRSTTDQQIKALAQAFYNQTVATQILEKAGVPLERIPGWQPNLNPEQNWREIHRALTLGIITNGWGRVLAAARRELPANPYFGVPTA
ncbi:effector-associated domain EAD1-containing protein [Frankia tisae]|uniref:effector-associated domain EAD1-containing protein n=1 Tax=Frankia tisae TaxID=2950104 RepID=UPI0021BE9275|nr:effector-associated domain EAD1-containing protein [Frankia tisae]